MNDSTRIAPGAHRKSRPKLLTMCVVWGAIWIVFALLSALLDDWMDGLELMVWATMFAVWCGLALASLPSLIWGKASGIRRAAPLLVCGATLLLLMLIVRCNVADQVEWQAKRNGYEQVAQMVQNGRLHEATGKRSIDLPVGFGWLSRLPDGSHRVLVQRRGGAVALAFLASRGFLSGGEYYVFCSDGRPPQASDFGWRLIVLQTQNTFWYRCRDDTWID